MNEDFYVSHVYSLWRNLSLATYVFNLMIMGFYLLLKKPLTLAFSQAHLVFKIYWFTYLLSTKSKSPGIITKENFIWYCTVVNTGFDISGLRVWIESLVSVFDTMYCILVILFYDRYLSVAHELVTLARGSHTGNNWKKKNGDPGSFDDISVFVVPLKHWHLQQKEKI